MARGGAADATDASFPAGGVRFLPQEEQLMLMMPALNPRSCIFLSQEVQLLLVMLALRPQSATHWPRELRLMLLMPVSTLVSDIHTRVG